MIFSNLSNLSEYSFLPNNLRAALDYACNKNLLDLDTGCHKINEEILFFNRVNCNTSDRLDRFWEAHKKYYDIHVILKGSERIDLNLIDNMKKLEYVEADDFQKIEGESIVSVLLNKNDFLICYPTDAHMTCINVSNKSTPLEKVIFKVLI